MQTPKKSLARLSFDEVRNELYTLQEGEGFQCIVMPRGRSCVNNIATDQMPHAKTVSQSCPDPPTVEYVRDLISCTMCDTHSQSDNYYKKVIEGQWEATFGTEFFSPRRSPSPYSRNCKRKTSLMARSCDSPGPRERSCSIASDRLAPSVVLTPPPEGSKDTPRRLSAPQVTAPSMNALRRHSNGSDSGDVFAETDEGVFDVSSPLRAQSRLRNDENSRGVRSSTVPEESNSSSLSAEAPPIPDLGPPERTPNPKRVRRKRHIGDSVHDDGFHCGAAHAWAPWTIRAGVIELLEEPVPGPETAGQLFVVRVNTGDCQRYVKIGITHRAVKTRLEEVGAKLCQQNVSLDMKSIKTTVKLPMMQITRLEKLVHADLAFFQRDLRIVKDKRISYGTEYFEISQEEAWHTVSMWIGIMERAGMLPGEDLDKEVKKGIHGCSVYLEAVDCSNQEAEVEAWQHINQDHEKRKLVWDGIPSRKSKTNDSARKSKVCDWFRASELLSLVTVAEASLALLLATYFLLVCPLDG